jgi:glycosyltransferase involved in cell wall biosynthesis
MNPNTGGTVAALVATFNRAKYLRECIDSLLGQSRPLDQIIVIDDGSTDGTSDVLSEYSGRIHVVSKPNGGKSTALNLGLDYALTDWVWFFDDDDVALPEAAELLLSALKREPQANFVYSDHIIGRATEGTELRRVRTVKHARPPEGGLFNQALKQFPFLMQGMLVSRQLTNSIGRFDPRYLRGQDYEFCLRLIRNGQGIALDTPTFVWRVHDGPRGPKSGLHSEAERGRVWQRFSEMMARELRETLPLSEYLVPHYRNSEALTAPRLRRALVERMAVMASKGLMNEAFEDLHAAVGLSGTENLGALDHESLKSIWLLATYPAFLIRLLENPKAVSQRIASGSGDTRKALKRTLARGVAWQALHGDWNFSNRVRILYAAALLWSA